MKLAWAIAIGAALAAVRPAAGAVANPAPFTAPPAAARMAPPAPGWQGPGSLRRLTAYLDLTPDQVAHIRAIMASTRDRVQMIQGDPVLRPFQKQNQVRMARLHQRVKIAALLTDAQFVKYWAATAPRRTWRGGSWVGPPAGPPPPAGGMRMAPQAQ